MNIKYVIVKYAAETAWEWHHNDDPKEGARLEDSCHSTYTGKEEGVLPEYLSRVLADIDCWRLNTVNPSGWYAVCPVKEESTPDACCGEYSTCSKPCTSRGIEIGRKEATYKGPSKFTSEEIARGNVGIRWVTPDEVCGRPTEHDVREYLHEAGQLGLCECPDCNFFYRSSKRLEGQEYAKVLHALEMNRVFVAGEKGCTSKEVTPEIILEAIEILKQLSKTEV